MANDRLMLVCRKCRQFVTLAAIIAGPNLLIREPNKWLRKFIEYHWRVCQERYGEPTFEGGPGFEALTETQMGDVGKHWDPKEYDDYIRSPDSP